jgi:protein-tyrosine-phosphatase
MFDQYSSHLERSEPLNASVNILTLCTGNAARSVMLGYMLTTLAEANGADWMIHTAGTHVAEGSAMSSRTRDALLRIPDLGNHSYNSHRGHQVTRDDIEWADVVLASEALHVLFVRIHYPEAARKTVLFGQFLHDAPLDESFVDQVSYVSSLAPDSAFDMEDPAGQDQIAYDQSATALWDMAQVFAALVEAS